MGLTIAVLVFFGLLAVWVLLPFLPGLSEIRRKTDAKPLPIARDSEVDIRYLAQRFRAFVKYPLTPVLDRCRLEGRNEAGVLEDGTDFLVLAGDGDPNAVLGAQSRDGCRHVVFSTRALDLPPKSSFLLELYGEDSVQAGSDSVYRAILAEESIRLGEHCTTLRWIHAGGSLRTSPGCRLMGRASADRAMRLASCCRFERLHAPRIEFGSPLLPGPPIEGGQPLEPKHVLNVVEAKAGRWLIKGALWLGARKVVSADLVATGRAEIGEGTRIEGSIKSHNDMILARGVVVTGSVVSGRSIRIGEGCRIHGPIIAEETITIAARCLLGSPDSQTTVNAKRIFMTPGVVCHGSVWAHEEGVLSGPDQDAPFVEEPRQSGLTQAEPVPQPPGRREPSLAVPARERVPESSPDPFPGAPRAAGLTASIAEETPAPALEPEIETVVAPERPTSFRHQPLPRETIRPSGPLTIGPASFISTPEWPASQSNLRRLVGDGSGAVDPRALPVPGPDPEGPALLLIVPRGNGHRGVRTGDPDRIATIPDGAGAVSGPIRKPPRDILTEDRDEG
jgi:cytoskeletal protein CcmA (bactofilin family)